jgi:hypothetical protein
MFSAIKLTWLKVGRKHAARPSPKGLILSFHQKMLGANDSFRAAPRLEAAAATVFGLVSLLFL